MPSRQFQLNATGRAGRESVAWCCLKTPWSSGLPGALLAAAVLLAGCSSSPGRPPVEDLESSSARGGVVHLPSGTENAGKPGYYTVQPGDTIRRIAAANNQDWREVVRWNSLDNPDRIEVGQVIRVAPPDSSGGGGGGGGAVAVATQTTPGVVASSSGQTPAAPPAAAAPASGGTEGMNFIWPASGAVLAGFDEAKNKGLDIGGKAGDLVQAAADGRVVYAGAGLRGYGKLIILKHNDTFLTAYAHKQAILVKEDQNVKQGQKIAEMGSTDAGQTELHFEIRRAGRPVNPAQYLPPR
jgi:lipoprotein NlpD